MRLWIISVALFYRAFERSLRARRIFLARECDAQSFVRISILMIVLLYGFVESFCRFPVAVEIEEHQTLLIEGIRARAAALRDSGIISFDGILRIALLLQSKGQIILRREIVSVLLRDGLAKLFRRVRELALCHQRTTEPVMRRREIIL